MWISLRRSLVHQKAIKSIKCTVQAGHRSCSSLRWLSVSCGTNQTDRPHVGIVGSGPAGFYTAQQILKVCICITKTNCWLSFPFPSPLRHVFFFWEGWVKKPKLGVRGTWSLWGQSLGRHGGSGEIILQHCIIVYCISTKGLATTKEIVRVWS